jgi:hypothetical protein
MAWATVIALRVVVDRASRAIQVNGPCPGCGHDFSVVLTGDDFLEETASLRGGTSPNGLSADVDWSGVIRFLATCYCMEQHDGRPSVIDHGCGASGWLDDEPES